MLFEPTNTKHYTARQRTGYRLKLIAMIAVPLCFFAYLAGHNEHTRQHEIALGKVHDLTVAQALPARLP